MTTNHAEPGDIETLNMKTKFVHDFNEDETVCIGVASEDAAKPHGTISLMLVQHSKDHAPTLLQACLTLEEVEEVIGALTLATFRMKVLQMSPSPEKNMIIEITKEWAADDWITRANDSVGDLHYRVTHWLLDNGSDFDLTTEAGLFEAKCNFEQWMGW